MSDEGRARIGRIRWGAWSLLAMVVAGSVSAPLAAQAQAGPVAPPGDSVRIDIWRPEEVIRRGGYLVWPILFCSLVTLTFGLERLVSLRRGRVIPGSFVRRFVARLRNRELDRHSAMQLCRQNGSPIAVLFLAATRHWGRPALDIEHAISDAAGPQVSRLRRNLRTLQGSANIATLLGLLGTVLGMIEAFNDVATAGALGQAEVLASGIAQALLTTALGLTVAIPSLILYNYFTSRVERLVYDMDELTGSLVDEISAEAFWDASQHAAQAGPMPAQPAPSVTG